MGHKKQTINGITSKFAPCIKCKGTDIKFFDYGYSSFNIGGGQCTLCNNEVTGQVGVIPTAKELRAIWNSQNDINYLKTQTQLKIDELTRYLNYLNSL